MIDCIHHITRLRRRNYRLEVGKSPADVARAILEPQKPSTIETPPEPSFASLPRDTAIALRWTLRDIDRKRTKLSPVSPADLKLLMEMGLVEINDDTLSLTTEGHRAIG